MAAELKVFFPAFYIRSRLPVRFGGIERALRALQRASCIQVVSLPAVCLPQAHLLCATCISALLHSIHIPTQPPILQHSAESHSPR